MAKVYKDFEKSVNDLITEDYTFKNEVEVKAKSSNNTTVTAALTVGGDGSLALKQKVAEHGFEGSVKATTANKVTLKASVDKLGVDGLKVNVEEELKGGKSTVKAGVSFKQPKFTFTTDATVLGEAKVDASVSGAYEALTLGGKVTLAGVKKDDKESFGLAGAEAGAMYVSGDFQLAARGIHSDKGLKVRAALFNNLSATTSVGATLEHARGGEDGAKNTLVLAAAHTYDPSTSVKANVSSAGLWQAQVQSKVSANAKIIACVQGNVSKPLADDQAAIGLKICLSN